MLTLNIVDRRRQPIFSVVYNINTTTTDLFQAIRQRIRGAPNMRVMNMRNRGEIHNDGRRFKDLDILSTDEIMIVDIGVGFSEGFPAEQRPIGDIPNLANVPPEIRDVFEAHRTEAVAAAVYNNAVRARTNELRARAGGNPNEEAISREAEAAGVDAVAALEINFHERGERALVGRRAYDGAYNAIRQELHDRAVTEAHREATAGGEAAERSAIASATASFHDSHGGPYVYNRDRPAQEAYWIMASRHGRGLDRGAGNAELAMALAAHNGGLNAQLARQFQLEEEGGAGAAADGVRRRHPDIRVELLRAAGEGMGRGAFNDPYARAAGHIWDDRVPRGGPNRGARAEGVPRGGPNPEIVDMERQLAQLQQQHRLRGARENRRPAPDAPEGRVALMGLEENIREAIPLEMINYIDGVGFVEEGLVERIRHAAYLRGVALSNINTTDDLVRQIVKQELVRKNGRLVQAYAEMPVGDCPICVEENRPLFRVHREHTVANGVCQICILDNLDGKIESLRGVDGPNDVKLPQPVPGSQELAADGAAPELRICGLEDPTCNRATSWYDLYKISCTNPLVVGEVNSCGRFKTLYRKFIEILDTKINRQRVVADEAFQRRASQDRIANIGALDRAIQQLRQQIQERRDREAAARNVARRRLINEFGRARALYNRERAAYTERVEQKRRGEGSNFKVYEPNVLRSRPQGARCICPWCIAPAELVDGCLTIRTHVCNYPVRELETRFRKGVDGHAYFCALCGRPQGGAGGHQHYSPDGTVLGPQAQNPIQYYNPDGVALLGCGGRGEYVARMIAMRNIIQPHIARGTYNLTPEIRRELALAMCDAAIAYHQRRPVYGISVEGIHAMLREAERTRNFDFLLVPIPVVGPEPQPPQRPRELNQLAAAPGAGAAAPGAGAAAPGAGAAAPGAGAAAPGAGAAAPDAGAADEEEEALVPHRPVEVPALILIRRYLSNLFTEWGGQAFDRCVPRFLRRRGGTRRHKKVVHKQTRKGRKGHKTRKN